MRTIIAALITLACAAPVSAQEVWYPNQNQVFINIDTPPKNMTAPPDQGFQPQDGAWVDRAGFYLSGWSFNCNGSYPALTLWRWDAMTRQTVQVAAQLFTGIPRPDVQAAFAHLPCIVRADVGWHLYPLEPLDGVQYLFVHGYSSGGTWHPVTGWPIPASRYDQRFVVFVR